MASDRYQQFKEDSKRPVYNKKPKNIVYCKIHTTTFYDISKFKQCFYCHQDKIKNKEYER